ncbi:MAG: LETM1-related biofilm-associated protein [Crocinitomicaceae bacterium]
MISPGAKGWINKYLHLVENGTITLNKKRPKEITKSRHTHLTLAKSGIVFGYPDELIFGKELNDSEWTKDEKLKLLLFESLLFVYTQIHKKEVFEKEKFLSSLIAFYESHEASSIRKVFGYFIKESPEEKLEKILADRIDIKLNLLENRWWINSLSNVFSYLDVILFDDFEHRNEGATLVINYTSYAKASLTAISVSAHADGVLEGKEKNLFNIFLASSNLKDEARDEVKAQFKEGATFEDIPDFVKEHWLLKRFLLDISILTIVSDEDLTDEELEYLHNLTVYLEIPIDELEESLTMTENFLLHAQHDLDFMKNSASYEKVYSRLSKRWGKILMRNKDRLGTEIRQSKDLVYLVKKSATEDLTKEEKELVKTQFKDIVKSVPALAIFMLPGGALLLPLILKVIPDLVPSAFKENEIDEK